MDQVSGRKLIVFIKTNSKLNFGTHDISILEVIIIIYLYYNIYNIYYNMISIYYLVLDGKKYYLCISF